ncbi:MAG: hypothetical protein IPL23_10825 [Saprospiraceae bacterium]|nr:hypothetical protein [Saprospiraceae bacterium]
MSESCGHYDIDENAVVGTPAAQYFFHVSNDPVFEVGLTPNRSDATLSPWGCRRLTCIPDHQWKLMMEPQ